MAFFASVLDGKGTQTAWYYMYSRNIRKLTSTPFLALPSLWWTYREFVTRNSNGDLDVLHDPLHSHTCYIPIRNFQTVLKPSAFACGFYNGPAAFKMVWPALKPSDGFARMLSKQRDNEQGCHWSNATKTKDAIKSATTSKDGFKKAARLPLAFSCGF